MGASLADYGDVLDGKQLAQVLQLSEWAVLEAARRKEIPSVRIGGRVRFYRAALEKWLAAGTTIKEAE